MKIPAILLATIALAQRGNKNKNQNISYQAPVDSYEPPAANYQAPADNYQAPAYGNNYKTPLKCWHCNAVSFEECASKGQEETCLVSSQELCW